MVYDNSLDNQHSTTRKFARRWFGPYVVTSANDKCHIPPCGARRIRVGRTHCGKKSKDFQEKKRQDENPDLDHLDDEHNRADVNEDMEESD